jgi:ParB-like chromosome segregation protein Spo0J
LQGKTEIKPSSIAFYYLYSIFVLLKVISNVIELRYHRFVELFPRMVEEDFEQFKKDIAINGLYIPILVLKDTDLIIDGRHRYEACVAAGIEPKIEYFSENDNRVLLTIVSLNSRRRYLSESQRAAVAAELASLIREDTLKQIREAAEKYLNIGSRTVEAAKTIKTLFPETWESIRLGEITVADAYKVCKESEEVKREIIDRWSCDKEAKRKIKKLAQYRKEVKQQAAKQAVEKAANSVLNYEAYRGEDASPHASIEVNECPCVNFGDVWKLGEHTLTCCDSSIWDAPKAKLAFADPPYNAGVADWDIGFEWKHDWLIDKADLVVVTPGDESFAKFLRTTTMPYKCMIAHWIKNGMSKSPMGYGNHIIAAIFCKESSPYKVTGKRNQNYSEGIIKVIEADDIDHPGRKPLDFVVVWIERLTKSGEVVIDPFLGSGTTLIAAEETGRICHGAEINPDYCAFILGKWIKAGKEIPKKIKNVIDISV